MKKLGKKTHHRAPPGVSVRHWLPPPAPSNRRAERRPRAAKGARGGAASAPLDQRRLRAGAAEGN